MDALTVVKKAELARLLGLTDQTIATFTKSGMPHTGDGHSRRYNLSEVVQWMTEHEVQKALKLGRKPIEETTEEAKLRKLIAEAEQKEWELAELRREMVSVDDADKRITAELERLSTKLKSIPGVWGPQIIGLKSVQEAVSLLSDLVFNLMTELSEEPEEDDDESVEGEAVVIDSDEED